MGPIITKGKIGFSFFNSEHATHLEDIEVKRTDAGRWKHDDFISASRRRNSTAFVMFAPKDDAHKIVGTTCYQLLKDTAVIDHIYIDKNLPPELYEEAWEKTCEMVREKLFSGRSHVEFAIAEQDFEAMAHIRTYMLKEHAADRIITVEKPVKEDDYQCPVTNRTYPAYILRFGVEQKKQSDGPRGLITWRGRQDEAEKLSELGKRLKQMSHVLATLIGSEEAWRINEVTATGVAPANLATLEDATDVFFQTIIEATPERADELRKALSEKLKLPVSAKPDKKDPEKMSLTVSAAYIRPVHLRAKPDDTNATRYGSNPTQPGERNP